MIEAIIKDLPMLRELDYHSKGTAVKSHHLSTQFAKDALALAQSTRQIEYNRLEGALVGYLADYQTQLAGLAGANNISNTLQGVLDYVDFLADNFKVSNGRVGELKVALMKTFIGKVNHAPMYIGERNMPFYRIAESELSTRKTALHKMKPQPAV
ncbi:hypothetical protein J4234_05745 [Candidatus Woesearchaeota archaeon]|nr:hypothetical protein [Candidatus Woesearchaeota archaeon]